MQMARIAAALVLTVAAVGNAYAITWGEPDAGANPHVGTLLFVQNGDGYFSCTGTLIAPRVMVTAGHCVAGRGADGRMRTNDVTYVRFEDDALAGLGSARSLARWFASDWLEVERVIAHPEWADYSQFPVTYDLGVVILKRPYYAHGGLLGTLPPLGFLERLNGADTNFFRVVGYGQQGTLKPTEQNDYVKYKGTVRLIELNSTLTAQGFSSVKFSNNPGTGGGTCYGDSGGPTFFQNTQIVVAVTSFGWAKNDYCIGNDYSFRLDTRVAHDFLLPILRQYGQ